ncbi:hypothetical protein MIND_00149500 [Mycena indigotica]|uniref:Uncharacterized protein n=1 Tax=Mycena indigotica TaxID=2126181 RepID=A0A8H6WIN1_9AGAR|nr:uncharacterized protein MIND_00149500 [Mycena indigotica]KAF7316308.1 hypothetical protein MIND_00149500 [Mycena indigotica]
MRPIHLVYLVLSAAAFVAANPISPARSPTSDTTHRLAVRQSSPADGDASPDVVLPPVEEVFALMAAPDTTAPSLASSVASSVVSPSPSTPSPLEKAQQSKPAPGTTHPSRLIFVAVVILAMLAVIIAVYVFSHHRHQMRMSKLDQLDGVSVIKKQGSDKDDEKHCSIVDISRNFPRSKFSVTSSDYPISARGTVTSYASTSDASTDDGNYDQHRDSVYAREQDRGMMDPAHFFALRSSSMSASPPRHSRIGSEPAFGIPRYDERSSRRSRSVTVSGGSMHWQY